MALTGKIAEALDGTAVERPGLSGFLSSRFDRFLNQLFASGNVAPQEAAAALEGRPGFVWLAEKPDAEQPGLAGLYCFTTLEQMRRRGLAAALVHASHEAAQARGIDRAVLQATASGRPAYARAGYREQQSLPVLLSP